MKIDVSRIGLKEQEVEDWLWENPHHIPFGFDIDEGSFRWVARQFRVPSGVIDLLGYATSTFRGYTHHYMLVIELKKDDITSETLTQVSRYAQDIDNIISEMGAEEHGSVFSIPCNTVKVAIGTSIKSKVFFEALSVDVMVHTLSAKVHVEVDGVLVWNDEKAKGLKDAYQKAGHDSKLAFLRDLSRPLLPSSSKTKLVDKEK